MESVDETDRVNNISQLYSSQEPEPFKHYFINKRLGKGKKKKEISSRLFKSFTK